jgi:hypothetical protein
MTFIPGKSGNMQGRPIGSSDKRTRFRHLLELHAEELISVLVNQAKNGDPTALKLCIDRLIPRVKNDTVDIVFPKDLSSHSILQVSEQILRGLENKSITPEEGKTLFEIIKSYCNTAVLADLNRRFELIEKNR